MLDVIAMGLKGIDNSKHKYSLGDLADLDTGGRFHEEGIIAKNLTPVFLHFCDFFALNKKSLIIFAFFVDYRTR